MVTSLPEKRRGRPLLELDKQVRAYVTNLRDNGAVVNTAIAVSCAEGIVKYKDSNLLQANGGHIALTGKNLLMVPANCTDRLQPMDISVNKPAKKLCNRHPRKFYSSKISRYRVLLSFPAR